MSLVCQKLFIKTLSIIGINGKTSIFAKMKLHLLFILCLFSCYSNQYYKFFKLLRIAQ